MVSKRAKERRAIRYASAMRRVETFDTESKSYAYKAPKGMKVFHKFPKDGEFEFDCIPFVANNNPFADDGDFYYERTYDVHVGLGPNKESHLCPRGRHNKINGNCPVCELASQLHQDPETKDLAKPLWPKTRQLWYFRDRENKSGGVMLYDLPYFGNGNGFGEMIQAKLEAVAKKPDHPYHSFYHLDDGSYLAISVKKDSFPGAGGTPVAYNKVANIELVKRSKPIPESILDDLPSLDDLLTPTKASVLQKLLDGTIAGTNKKAKGKRDEDDEEEEDEEIDSEDTDDETVEDEDSESDDDSSEDEGDCPVAKGDRVRFKYKGKTLKGVVAKINEAKELIHVKVDGKADPSIIAFDDETLEVVEDEKPAKQAKPSKAKRKDDDDEDEDADTDGESEDEEDDDEGSDDGDDEGEDESDDEEDEDEEVDEGDDDPKPSKPSRGSSGKSGGKSSDDDDESDDDEPFDDDDDFADDDEDEKPKKKVKRKR